MTIARSMLRISGNRDEGFFEDFAYAEGTLLSDIGFTVLGGTAQVDADECAEPLAQSTTSLDTLAVQTLLSGGDGTIKGDLITPGSGNILAGIAGRVQDVDNWIALTAVVVGVTEKWAIIRRKAGSNTILDEYITTISYNTTYALELIFDGSSLTGNIDGTTRMSATNSDFASENDAGLRWQFGTDANDDNLTCMDNLEVI